MNRRKVRLLGQHFLRDNSVLKKIIRCISPQRNELIIEIGAGKGALTIPLAQRAGKVLAIERDAKLIPLLKKREVANVEILEEDILKVSFEELVEREKGFQGGVKVVGNLPYSISSPVLFKVLGDKEYFSQCTFLLQKEVAERICARPGVKRYAPLSIFFQIYFSTRLHFTVEPKSFSPPPKVESALITLKKRARPLFSIKKEELFMAFLKGAFRHRRKILINNLVMNKFSPPIVKSAFRDLGLSSLLRPEQLSISQFVDLFNLLSQDADL